MTKLLNFFTRDAFQIYYVTGILNDNKEYRNGIREWAETAKVANINNNFLFQVSSGQIISNLILHYANEIFQELGIKILPVKFTHEKVFFLLFYFYLSYFLCSEPTF